MPYGILVIEDEAPLARNIQKYFERHGYDVRVCGDGESGLKVFEEFHPDLVIMDYRLPGVDGMETLRRMRHQDERAKIILMTAYGGREMAVSAIERGAYAYVSKPIILGELKVMVDKALGQRNLENALRYYRTRAGTEGGFPGLVGESAAVQALRRRICQIVDGDAAAIQSSPSPVLVVGEGGAGKRTAAKTIHFVGARREFEFVEINCAVTPKNQMEAMLFGRVHDGAGHSAPVDPSYAELANCGTLFLQEISHLDLDLQEKLLHLIESQTINVANSHRSQKLSLWVIASSGTALEPLVQEGRFLPDLFEKLSVRTVIVPPLRAREGDVEILARHFLERLGCRHNKPNRRLSTAAERALLAYSWPGNLRELYSVLEQAVRLSWGEVIQSQNLSLMPSDVLEGTCSWGDVVSGREDLPPEGIDLGEVERNLVVAALNKSQWNISRAARLLGLSRDTLRYRIEKFQLRRASQ